MTTLIGENRHFQYPGYGTPDGHPEHTAHSGQTVLVVRQLTDEECDPECQPMYVVQADDGWEGHVNGSELFPVESSGAVMQVRIRALTSFGIRHESIPELRQLAAKLYSQSALEDLINPLFNALQSEDEGSTRSETS